MSCNENRIRIGDTNVGYGVFAAEAIAADEQVGEVLGDVSDALQTDDCYHIDLNCELALDPCPPFRYLNHSCDPNCELLVVSDDDRPDLQPQVYVMALRDIQGGEQLTIDYGWPAEAAIECKCGSDKCRGWVVAECELYLVGQDKETILALKYPPEEETLPQAGDGFAEQVEPDVEPVQ